MIYRNIYWRGRRVPFLRKKDYLWSIGIYAGDSPFALAPHGGARNPVLTAEDVTDVAADFVADPFMVKEDDTWYMFFEVMNSKTKLGHIGLATSKDGLSWRYEQIVLKESVHLSYPYTFKWNNEYYMIPESTEAADKEMRIYTAVRFPTQWKFVKALLKGRYADSSIFHFNGRWWIFAETNPKGGHDTLGLYFADNPMGPWEEHPKNPVVVGDRTMARPGGRVIEFDRRIIRFAQDASFFYGNAVRAFEIVDLTTETYEEKEVTGNPILRGTGHGWNKKGMHHIDPHHLADGNWIACVDGFKDSLVFAPHP